MQNQSFSAVLRGLDQALDFLRGIGLRPDHSRFDQYRRRLEHLIGVIEPDAKGRVDAERLQPFSDLEYMIALTESTELGTILPYLHTCDPAMLGPKLESGLKGPVLPSDEDPTSNRSRNILFELNMAARLWRAGAQPILDERPDIRCAVAGIQVFVECKRPFREDTVGRRIKEADRGLDDALKSAAPGARGVIAVSVSRALNRGDLFLEFAAEGQGRQGLADQVEAVAHRVKDRWDRLGRKIVAIIFHAITPIRDKSANMYVVAQQIVVYPLATGEGSRSTLVLGALTEGLEAIGY